MTEEEREAARQAETKYQAQKALDDLKKKQEEKEAKIKAETQKNIQVWAEGFYGETEKHRMIREQLYKFTNEELDAGPWGKTKNVENERVALRKEYNDLHYQLPEKYVFRKVTIYVCDYLDIQMISIDFEKTWKVEGKGLSNFKATPTIIIDKDSKLPTGLTFYLANGSLYELKHAWRLMTGQLADAPIRLITGPETPKIVTPKPKEEPKKDAWKDFPPHEHNYSLGIECCICGKPKGKEE